MPGGCNNDILRSVSTDAGATFTGGTTPPAELEAVSHDGAVPTDQWWQWTALNPKTGGVVTAFYDRRYGDCQATGCMDITLRRSNGSFTRVTHASMPPSNEFPDVNGFSVFMGDYMGLAVGSDGVAHPVWTDTRNPTFLYDPAADDPRVPDLRRVRRRHLHGRDQGHGLIRARIETWPRSGWSRRTEGPARPAPPSTQSSPRGGLVRATGVNEGRNGGCRAEKPRGPRVSGLLMVGEASQLDL